jgi:hypothetical protein
MRIIYIFLIIEFIAVSALAASLANFSYQGKPIEPNCILKAITANKIDLAKCSKPQDKKIEIAKITDNGFFGYSYTNIHDKDCDYSSCWIYYKYLGMLNGKHIVLVNNATGGTGRFSDILFLKNNGKTLKVTKRIIGGDRSFGGIINAEIKDNHLIYSKAITPLMFINHFKSNNYTALLENGENQLLDCAICQFVSLNYIDGSLKLATLNSVELPVDENNILGHCFNLLHDSFINNKHLNLTPKEAKDFVKDFYIKCMSRSKY